MTMTKQDRICMISLFAVMLVLMGVPALCLSTNTVVVELGTLTNTALFDRKKLGNRDYKQWWILLSLWNGVCVASAVSDL